MKDTDELLKYTIPQLLRWRVKKTGDKVALREKDFGYWNSYTWNDIMIMSAKPPWDSRKSVCKRETRWP